MPILELVKQVLNNLNELNTIDVDTKEFKSLVDATFELLKSTNTDEYENGFLIKNMLKLHCDDHITFLTMMFSQTKFNEHLMEKLINMGADSSELNDYVTRNIKPLFSNL